MASSGICSIPDCGKGGKQRLGLCSSHYLRLRRHGDPLGGRTSRGDAATFFSETVMSHDGDECLIWPFSKQTTGYGLIRHGGRMHYVHRLLCEIVHGPAPTIKHEAAHSCGRGHLGCVAKGHLSWKTHRENEADKVAHGTLMRGVRHTQAKLTEEDVSSIRSLQGKFTQERLAQRFGVTRSQVSQIQLGKCWTWFEQDGTQ